MPGISVTRFFTTELTRGYLLEREEEKYAQKRQRVYTFMKTPRELEKFSIYGFFQCVDAFLFIFTFLPLRILLALLKVITVPCGFLRSRKLLEPAQICDILKGVILLVCCGIMSNIDTSMMYHLVRGQATIKLYVFFNMLDMADRLLSNFGHDILDALFWTATEPRGRKRDHLGTLPHLAIACIYVMLHTLLILFQATVLNVAFNSHNKSLLVIMMSNNFVEIKANLFKKVDASHLYQIACSDVKERFHYVLLLSVVCIRNMTEVSWNLDHLWVLLPDAIMVLLSEVLVDWGKHAFILKFNEIPADVYREFKVKLAVDMANSRQSQAFTDHSDLVSRRMGLTPLPLACLLFRILSKTVKLTSWLSYAVVFVLYLCLISFKILNSIILLGHSYKVIESSSSEKLGEGAGDGGQGEEVAGVGPGVTDSAHTVEPGVASSASVMEESVTRPASDSNIVRNFTEILSADSYTELTFIQNDNVIEHSEGITFVTNTSTKSTDALSTDFADSKVNDSNLELLSSTSVKEISNGSLQSETDKMESCDTDTRPVDTELQSHDSKPQSHDSKPQSHDSKPQSHDSKPQSHDLHQQSHDSKPQSHDSNLQSHDSGLQSHDSELQSKDSKPRSHDNLALSSIDTSVADMPNHAADNDLSHTQPLPNDTSPPEDSLLGQRNQRRYFINFGSSGRFGSSSSLPEMVSGVCCDEEEPKTAVVAEHGDGSKSEKLE